MSPAATHQPPAHGNSLVENRFLTASDPETPPAILSMLAAERGDDDALCEALALNPNTPLPDLFELWIRKPLAALENPILTFLTLQNGKVLHQIVPGRIQHALYVALRSAGRDAELNEHLPVKARLKWFNTQEPGTEFYHRCPEPEPLQAPTSNGDYERRKREDAFTQRLFTYLANDPSPRVRKDMVSKIPTHTLGGYRTEPRADIRLLHAKRVSENHGGRSLVEQRVLEELRDTLSKDAEESVRGCIAEGSALENPIFERLARDPSLRVREQLAGRKVPNDTRLCVEAWKTLAETNTETARLVALNHACPFSLRLKLTEHPDLKVRKNAWSVIVFRNGKRQTLLLQRVEQILDRPHKHPELRTIAANKTIPPALAARLAKEKDPLPRIVAANPQLLENERRRLLSEGDHRAARTALEHATGNEILWEALRHPSPGVRAALVRKKGVHASRIRFLLAKDTSADVRRFLVSHLVDAKNLDESERKVVRPQIELVLASATPMEKQGLLYLRPLRKLLALWKARDSLNPLNANS